MITCINAVLCLIPVYEHSDGVVPLANNGAKLDLTGEPRPEDSYNNSMHEVCMDRLYITNANVIIFVFGMTALSGCG